MRDSEEELKDTEDPIRRVGFSFLGVLLATILHWSTPLEFALDRLFCPSLE
jgi:hypothetical protein